MNRWYLLPFSPFYGLVVFIRNFFFNVGIISSKRFNIPVIGIGNLSVGGTGKSPMVMYLASFLTKNDKRTGVLSRGYGRATKGYRLVNYDSTYKSVGDEAMQLFNRLRNSFSIAVCENRVLGATKLIGDMGLDVLLLDDSYQHRYIKPSLNILLTEYDNPFFNDYLLPAGNLRESRIGRKRADIIVVTKCPNALSELKKKFYKSKIKPKKHQKIFFSSIDYANEVISKHDNIPIHKLEDREILLITGIANPNPLIQELVKYTHRIKHLKFNDHHPFTESDVENIMNEYNKLGEDKIMLTTEKDYVRLKIFNYLLEDCLYYLPINISIENSAEFNDAILKHISNKIEL